MSKLHSILLVLACLISTLPASTQTPLQRSVLVSAVAQTQPAQLEFSWPTDPAANGYQVFRKPLEAVDWGSAIAQLDSDATRFTDTNLQRGDAFEYAFYKKEFELVRDTFCISPGSELKFTISDMYGIGLCCSFGFGYYRIKGCNRVYAEGDNFGWETSHSFTICNDSSSCVPLYITIKPDVFPNSTSWSLENLSSSEVIGTSGPQGTFIHDRPEYGFIYAGVEAPAIEDRGRVLILVQEAFADSLATELEQLKLDYIRDGWRVLMHAVPTQMPPSEVRQYIQSAYQQYPDLTALYIVGHVAVPYSGDIYPDTHPEHRGAWAADTYYGELNGNWTDNVVNITTAQFEYNHNVPGDGRWDQDSIPSLMELQVGRVDFFDMPALNKEELELLRRYLQKAHLFKNGHIPTVRRALIDDNFDAQFGAPAASGWRNFAPMFGAEQIVEADYFSTMHTQPYLWSYGCGSGSHISASGIGTTHDFAADSLQGIFTMLFGSQFGDWDNHNNFLRSALASGTILTNCWAGNPPYTFHQMALGQHIGYCLQRTQNSTEGVYLEGPQLVHTALLGDPGLRLHPIRPVDSLWISATGQSVELSWTAAPEADVMGYYLYRSDSLNGFFERIHPELLTDTFFVDLNPIEGNNVYMLKAVKLEQSGSGTYFNTSLGTIGSVWFERQLAVEKGQGTFNIRLFPNPAVDQLVIKSEWPVEAVDLFDINGRLHLHLEPWRQNPAIDLSGLPTGVYICKVRLKENVHFMRLVVSGSR